MVHACITYEYREPKHRGHYTAAIRRVRPAARTPPREMDRHHEYWVFGYGSLCWNPGFDFKDSMIGYVQGFSRKFWQGNIAHRGTKEKVRK